MAAKSWEEYKAECEAVAKEGITILGYVGEWRGSKTKLHCSCSLHGEWKTTNIHNFKRKGSCPKCGLVLAGKMSKPSGYCIEKFKSASGLPEGTIFTRLSGGFWQYTCPVCSDDEYVKARICPGVFKTRGPDLVRGYVPCRCGKSYRYTKEQWEYRLKKECLERGYLFLGWVGDTASRKSKFKYLCDKHGEQKTTPNLLFKGSGCPLCAGHTQREAYINIVYDESVPVALKLGISVSSKRRIVTQNNSNLFQMECVQVYDFPTVDQCKQAERACLSELECGILSPKELKDGYSETTSLLNLDKVISIYERFGGVKRLTGETYERKERIS